MSADHDTMRVLGELLAQKERQRLDKERVRYFADKLNVNSFAVEGLLNLAQSGANLEQLVNRWREIRSAITDPNRLKKAFGDWGNE